MIAAYLKLYNLVLSLAWAVLFLLFVANKGELSTSNLLLLNIAQGAAVLEILHALLAWVKSPVFTTTIQVSSRIFILVLINILFGQKLPEYFSFNGLHLALAAWSITEVIRYAYYLLLLLKKSSSLLLFSRYTFFIVLYPVGVTGELLILYAWATQNGIAVNNWQIWFMAAIAILYILFFPKMYMHMWKQRRQKL